MNFFKSLSDLQYAVSTGNTVRVRNILEQAVCSNCSHFLFIDAKNYSCLKHKQKSALFSHDVERNITESISWKQVNLKKNSEPNESEANVVDKTNILFVAVKNEFVDIVKILLDFGADVNATDKYGQTALHIAITQNKHRPLETFNSTRSLSNIEMIVKHLLVKGTDVNALTNNGFSALHYAVNFGYSNIVSLLLTYRADMNTLVEENIKHAETGACFSIGDEIRSREYLDVKKEGLTTILHIAVRKNFTEIIQLLIQEGARVDAVQDDGKTPLMLATDWNFAAAAKILVDHGADVNFKDTNRLSVLHYAVEKGSMDIVQILLKKEAQVDPVDSNGDSPMMIAIGDDQGQLINSLLWHGADVDLRNKWGMTPLHVACQKGDLMATYAFLDAGADVNAIDNCGMVPYQLATPQNRTQGTDAVKELLQRYIHIMRIYGVHLHHYNKSVMPSKIFSNKKHLMPCNVENFKRKVVVNTITIGHILTHDVDPVYISSETVMQQLTTMLHVLANENLILKYVLKCVIRKAKKRVKRLNTAEDLILNLIIISENHLPSLPKEIVRRILCFLNDEELETFIDNVQKLYFRIGFNL